MRYCTSSTSLRPRHLVGPECNDDPQGQTDAVPGTLGGGSNGDGRIRHPPAPLPSLCPPCPTDPGRVTPLPAQTCTLGSPGMAAPRIGASARGDHEARGSGGPAKPLWPPRQPPASPAAASTGLPGPAVVPAESSPSAARRPGLGGSGGARRQMPPPSRRKHIL